MGDRDMARLTQGLRTKAAKIRALAAAGVARAEIARFLNIRYQHVRNVLTAPSPETAEGAAPPSGRPPASASVTMRMNDAGALLAALRGAGMRDHETVSVEVEPGKVTVRSFAVALEEARSLAAPFLAGKPSAADELIKERRADAKRENG
jgi:hypothetical protein